ncbi:MAG: nucleoside triphosphate pyrophosphohydrolase [Anaerolineae bacterium]|nr:nucleoside triphosphate pyrophosphohydrolase [Anaerolineae bacterium]
MNIIILGLGPGDPAHLTGEARQVLEAAEEIYLRTQEHPAVAGLPAHLRQHSFDHLYETQPTFAAVYEAIAQEVLRLGARPQGVLYAVPGHPWVGEATTPRICRLASERGIPVRVVGGMSFLEPLLAALGVDPVDGLQVADAMLIAAGHHPSLNVDQPAVIAQCYSRTLASDVKLTLLNAYPDEHPVTIVKAAGTAAQQLITLPLYELDRGEHFDHLTSLYLPPVAGPGSYASLQEVVARLRAPDGCPWDREQTHQTLRPELLEETYELLAALDAEDAPKMCEELGDLLLEITLHIQIATEEGEFKMPDVIAGIVNKLKRRHPHVFGKRAVSGVDEVLRNWEEIKQEERGHKEPGGLLKGVSPALPALAQAQAYQHRLARVGFQTLERLGLDEEEMATVACLLAGTEDEEGQARLGDRLLALAELARQRGIDLESVLRAANARLAARFEAGDGRPS